MYRISVTLMGLVLLFGLVTALMAAESAPTARNDATLGETLQWLSGASEAESGDGNNHHTFESDDNDSCSVAITETRAEASPDYWIKLSFSLGDIDPEDIHVSNLAEGWPPGLQVGKAFAGKYAVNFHTTNYAKKIISRLHWHPSSESPPREITGPVSDYIYYTNDGFAPKFAKALKHAVELCGGKPSSF